MEPVMTIAAVFAGAEAAVKGVRQAVKLGKEVRECYHEIKDFFQAQGHIELEYQKTQDPKHKQDENRSATDRALDIVFMRREMIKMETELREMLVYGFNESGLYEEMCAERAKIIAKDQQALRESRMRQEALKAAEVRRKRKIRNQIETAVAIVIAVFLSLGTFYGIFWMFQQGGQW